MHTPIFFLPMELLYQMNHHVTIPYPYNKLKTSLPNGSFCNNSTLLLENNSVIF
jgi:hypothetical protein